MSWWDGPVTRRSFEHVVLEEVRHGITEELGPYARDRTELIRRLDDMRITLITAVLAERLPAEQVRERRHEVIRTARFATWWDHFKATYQQRWWMRWRRWTVRQLVDEHELEATAVVDLQRYWTFPRAAVSAPQLGDPVPVVTWERAPGPVTPPVTRFLRD